MVNVRGNFWLFPNSRSASHEPGERKRVILIISVMKINSVIKWRLLLDY